MTTLRTLSLIAALFIIWFTLTGCAGGAVMNKAPQDVLMKLANGESLDLIVEFDDSAFLAQASQMNSGRNIDFIDNNTLQIKSEVYTSMKASVIATLPSGKVDILKDYDILPLMFLRIHSAEALKILLAHPSVLRVHEDRKEYLMH